MSSAVSIEDLVDEDGEISDDALDAWSTYKMVAAKVHDDVAKAADAYAHYNSMRTHNMGMTPQTAVKVKRYILRVCKRLLYELKMSQSKDGLGEIYERWEGDGGYIARLERANLWDDQLNFLDDLVDDMIEASWRLGYLESGRMVEQFDDPDVETEAQVRDMFA